jgi:hypothetical protein
MSATLGQVSLWLPLGMGAGKSTGESHNDTGASVGPREWSSTVRHSWGISAAMGGFLPWLADPSTTPLPKTPESTFPVFIPTLFNGISG